MNSETPCVAVLRRSAERFECFVLGRYSRSHVRECGVLNRNLGEASMKGSFKVDWKCLLILALAQRPLSNFMLRLNHLHTLFRKSM